MEWVETALFKVDQRAETEKYDINSCDIYLAVFSALAGYLAGITTTLILTVFLAVSLANPLTAIPTGFAITAASAGTSLSATGVTIGLILGLCKSRGDEIHHYSDIKIGFGGDGKQGGWGGSPGFVYTFPNNNEVTKLQIKGSNGLGGRGSKGAEETGKRPEDVDYPVPWNINDAPKTLATLIRGI